MSQLDDKERIISDEKLAEYKAKYGRIEYITYNDVEIVFRQPKRAECQDHARQGETEEKVTADEQLALKLVVQCGPATDVAAREALRAMYETYGYMAKSKKVSCALARLTGLIEEEHGK